ncbi:MAG: OB-fold nucleic acid binding domain-containing protein [Candidatus Helarchaeota archaeon]
MEKSFFREPALKKRINDITKDDSRVQVIGTIVKYIPGLVHDSNTLSEIILSDETGIITILVDEYLDGNYKKGDKIRVFGHIESNDDDKLNLNAEVIQDMNSLNIELYKKIRELRTRIKG